MQSGALREGYDFGPGLQFAGIIYPLRHHLSPLGQLPQYFHRLMGERKKVLVVGFRDGVAPFRCIQVDVGPLYMTQLTKPDKDQRREVQNTAHGKCAFITIPIPVILLPLF